MRTNIDLDEQLVEEALALTGVKTKRELVHRALREMVTRLKRKDLTDLAGQIRFRDDFDHKAMRAVRGAAR